VKGVSEKFKRIGDWYIRAIFKTKHTLRVHSWKPSRQQTAQCIYSIPCECDSSKLAKQANLKPSGFSNIRTISNRVF
jgi:hypothetical protein